MNDAFLSIGAFAFLFILFSFIQHLLMVFLYNNLFVKLKEIKYVGGFFSWPTVTLHELVGHLIPALLSGSNVVGLDLRKETGQVAIKYEKNLFGAVSVFIAGFGPTFFLPLLFIILYMFVRGYDVVQFFQNEEMIGKFTNVLKDLCRVEDVGAFLLAYAAIIIAPGAASSAGDMNSVKAFVSESPLMVIALGIIALFVMYASFTNGFLLSEYGIRIIENTFAAYVMMYILSILFLFMLVRGNESGMLGESVVFLAIMVVLIKLGGSIVKTPFFEYPLLSALLFTDFALILIGLKRKLIKFK